MKRLLLIGIAVLLAMASCQSPTRKARQMVKRAERLADTLPDSAAHLIDSVLRIPAHFTERERMEMAQLQAEALFGNRDVSGSVSTLMDDDYFDTHANLSTSPELERAAAYYADRKHYGKAGHAALYSGFVQQHYNEKEAAMQSFKDAVQYGSLDGDSLTVALAQYRMGKMLYHEGQEAEALKLFESISHSFDNRLVDKALLLNIMAACHILQSDYDNAHKCLEQSLMLSEKGGSDKVKRKTLINIAVLYRIQGQLNQAINCLRLVADEQELLEKDEVLLYLNLGKTFVAQGQIDSAAVYYERMEKILPNNGINETQISAYGALSRFAESLGDEKKALQFREIHEELLYEVMIQRQTQSIYRIQQQYDYESLQNVMNQKLIRKQRFATFAGLITIIGLAALAVSQIRLARMRKQEAEAKTRLFHFIQQNEELTQKHETSKKAMAQQLSDVLNKEALIIRKFDVYLRNKGEAAYLAALKEAVFDNKDSWDALMEVFDALYPEVRANLPLQYPEMTEIEQKVFILSYFNVSREEEALLLQKNIHSVDKIRGAVRQRLKKTPSKQS